MIPYEDLRLVNSGFSEALRQQFEAVISNGWYILGEHVKHFESDFAQYHHVQHCIGVANGLDALVLSLKALQLLKGSEVIVPSNTYIATILAVIHAGLTPVLVEPGITTYNIDPLRIEAAITSRTVAIMVVHLYGKCCEMDAIDAVCKKHQLFLLEDCAQAHGAKYKNKLCGTFGAMAAFSFYPTKNLGCLGDGGAVLTGNAGYNAYLRMLRNYGSAQKYHNAAIGYNSRLDELQAAFLQVKLPALENINAQKKKLAAIYLENLKDDFIKPVVSKDHDDVYHIFAVRHEKRDVLREYLAEKGVGTEIHYPIAPHKQQALQSFYKEKQFPISEEIHRTIISLPCSTAHTAEDIYKVVEVMNSF